MGDSDDEYERRRSRDGREKFRRERSDYDRHADDRHKDAWDQDRVRGGGRSREWGGRGPDRGGRDPYGRDARRREPPYERQEMPQPQKRMRRDWEYDGGPRPYMMPYGGQPMHRAPAPWPHQPHGDMPVHPAHMEPFPEPNQPIPQRVEVDYPTQPLMLTFKQFLGQQEDNISDQDAIKKYNAYKSDFKKQQISQFFLAHKDNEWFKSKFHPDECIKRKLATRVSLANRLAVFRHMYDNHQLDSVTVDTDKSDALAKLLNAVIIKLEGGTDFDLQSLDMPEVEEETPTPQSSVPEVKPADPVESAPASVPDDENTFTLEATPRKKKRKHSNDTEKKSEEPLNLDAMTEEQKELQKAAEEFSKNVKNVKKSGDKDRSYSYDSESASSSDSENEPAPPGLDEDGGGTNISDKPEVASLPTKTIKEDKASEEKERDEQNEVSDTKDDSVTKPPAPQGPQPLHKTLSIFLRHLAPSITKTEVEAICKRYPGYMRVALQDPLPDRNFFRRGWVTFDRTVNIRDICWNLNNIRLRECELNATINRELKQRVRPVAAITAHKQIVRQDIKLAAKLVTYLDSKWQLWEVEGDRDAEKTDAEKRDASFGLSSRNPILKNITQYLVEEGSFEEDELIGQTSADQPKDVSNDLTIDRDPVLIQVLDRMVLYLRIVHSVDYYSVAEFPNEDEMPHRCGIMHARSHLPPTRMTQTDVNEWLHNFETRIKHFLTMRQPLDDKEIADLGRKDPDAEVEKFVTANTQELGKDKWLCPLSGKKFKGPDFVRKHILNKHQEKIDEVKKEVAYFNNYLLDPKRPQLPEHPGNRASAPPQHNYPHNNYPAPHHPGMMGYNHPRPPMMHGYGHPMLPYRGYGRDMYRQEGPPLPRRPTNSIARRSDPRAIVDYRDLDAPDDTDIF